MISIIPEREIMLAVTDKNVSSQPSTIRINCFNKANYLMSENDGVEIVIEGILYDKISERLNADHKRVFESLYEIDRSAQGLETKYDITKAIKFIVKERKLIFSKRKVIILTENTSNFDDMQPNHRLKVMNPKEFIEKVNSYDEIKETENSKYTAMIVALFY